MYTHSDSLTLFRSRKYLLLTNIVTLNHLDNDRFYEILGEVKINEICYKSSIGWLSVTILNLCHQVAFKEWAFNLDFQSWNSIMLERAQAPSFVQNYLFGNTILYPLLDYFFLLQKIVEDKISFVEI